MKTALALFLLLLVHSASADALGEEIAALRITYPAGRNLSSNELRQVLQLAREIGMRRVTEIVPAGGQTRDQGLMLRHDTPKGARRIVRQTLPVWPNTWKHDRTAARPKYAEAKRIGEFYAGDIEVFSQQMVQFNVDGKTNFVECAHSTDFALADRVLEAMVHDELDFKDEDVKKQYAGFDVRELSSVTVSATGGIISVRSGSLCWKGATFEIRKGRIMVVKVVHICA